MKIKLESLAPILSALRTHRQRATQAPGRLHQWKERETRKSRRNDTCEVCKRLAIACGNKRAHSEPQNHKLTCCRFLFERTPHRANIISLVCCKFESRSERTDERIESRANTQHKRLMNNDHLPLLFSISEASEHSTVTQIRRQK